MTWLGTKLLNWLNIHDLIHEHVKEELTRLQAKPQRHVACLNCGKTFDLSTHPMHTRAITIVCDGCRAQFEVRPSLFWEKLEVERR